MSLALCISILFIPLLQVENGAQLLNITPLFLSFNLALAPVIVIFPLTSMNA